MLPIQFTGHKIEVTDAIKNLTIRKFKRLEKHVDKIIRIHVTFTIEKLLQLAEAKIHIPGTEIYAKAQSEDMYKTIDVLVSKLIKQIDKYKGKQDNHH